MTTRGLLVSGAMLLVFQLGCGTGSDTVMTPPILPPVMPPPPPLPPPPPPSRAGIPARLAFLTQPPDTTEGARLGVFQVTVLDSAGSIADTSTVRVTLRLRTGSDVALSGGLTVAAKRGIATFDSVFVTGAGSSYVLSA